jgi:predicted transcriptional regulator
MTRTYALKRLLEHGNMTRREIMEVMGGNESSASEAICALYRQGIIKKFGWGWADSNGRKTPIYGLNL